jgi:hypothetical protein
MSTMSAASEPSPEAPEAAGSPAPAGLSARTLATQPAFAVKSICTFFGGTAKHVSFNGGKPKVKLGRPQDPNSKAGQKRAQQISAAAAAAAAAHVEVAVHAREQVEAERVESAADDQLDPATSSDDAREADAAKPKRDRAARDAPVRAYLVSAADRIDDKGKTIRQVKCRACSWAQGKDVLTDNLNSVKRQRCALQIRCTSGPAALKR